MSGRQPGLRCQSSSAPGGGDRLFDAKKLRVDRISVTSHQELCGTPTEETAPAKGPKTQEWRFFSELFNFHSLNVPENHLGIL